LHSTHTTYNTALARKLTDDTFSKEGARYSKLPIIHIFVLIDRYSSKVHAKTRTAVAPTTRGSSRISYKELTNFIARVDIKEANPHVITTCYELAPRGKQ
jgi:hypothetical protein